MKKQVEAVAAEAHAAVAAEAAVKFILAGGSSQLCYQNARVI